MLKYLLRLKHNEYYNYAKVILVRNIFDIIRKY